MSVGSDRAATSVGYDGTSVEKGVSSVGKGDIQGGAAVFQ